MVLALGHTGARVLKYQVAMVTRRGQGHVITQPRIMTGLIVTDQMRKLTHALFVDKNIKTVYLSALLFQVPPKTIQNK